MIYLVREQIVENKRGQTAAWENQNQNFYPGYWIPEKSLQWLRTQSGDVTPLACRDTLPVFFGNYSASASLLDIKNGLTAFCLSRTDGSTIRAIINLSPYGDYRHSIELGRCFEYENGFWHLLSHAGDLEWVQGHWLGDELFYHWLAQHPELSRLG